MIIYKGMQKCEKSFEKTPFIVLSIKPANLLLKIEREMSDIENKVAIRSKILLVV